VDDPSQADWLK